MLGFRYVSVLNIPGVSICQSSEFPGLCRVYLFSWIWQGSEYALGCNYGRVFNILDFRICQIPTYVSVTQDSEYAWIWLNNVWTNCSKLWQGSEHAWSTFHRVFIVPPLLNMPELRIWQGCANARVTQGVE